MEKTSVLSLNNLSKRFGSVLANDAINLTLKQGEVLALLGENGAGKTTLMNMLFGHYVPDSGSIDVADETGKMHPLTLGHPQAALDAGIGMVHQHFTLAENLSSLDNILLGSESLFSWRHKRKKARKKITAIMQRTGLSAPLDEKIGQLSVGERQRVEILKALYHDAKILVLDEPTAVLTPNEADTLFENIAAMTREGLSVIFISHKLHEVLAFSQRIVVLRHGKLVGEIITADANERKIAQMMVGADTPATPRQAMPPGAPVLDLKSLTIKGENTRNSLYDADLCIHSHEIVGIAGVSGNGQSALARVISGLITPNSGSISMNGEKLTRFTPPAMLKAGVGRIPEDRHHDGIIGAMSVSENLIIERLSDSDVQTYGFLKQHNIATHAKELCAAYDVRGPGIESAVRLLSGGNIQKLILARVFESSPHLILANQPTRGLDLGAAGEVARRLLEARRDGAGILLISEDLDEVLALADRVFVIHNGHLTIAHNKDRTTIGLMMAGEKAC
ncbi:MAG: ABC transporter ATP-binding protein [Devosiaceae bacterium]|nr:ABC transporter ATP-binding protein [Devosiaceae bacterium]